MKKLNLFLLGLGALGMVQTFNSCTEDVTHPAPSVSFDQASPVVLGAGVTSATVTGTIVAEAELESVTFTIATSGGETSPAPITDFSSGAVITSDDVNYTFSYVLNDITENTTFTVRADDKDGQHTSSSIEIQVAGINTYTAILMGAQGNATYGSFLDADEGDVYLIAQAEAHSELIDVVYYYGSTNLATLTAPDDVTVNGGAGNLSLCVDFTTKNETRFTSSSLTAAEFDDIDSGAEIASLSGFSESKITDLAVDDVIAFETEGGKKGLIKVADMETGSGGTITIDVKVQE